MFNVDDMVADLWPKDNPDSWQERLVRRLVRPVYLQALKSNSWQKRLIRTLVYEKEFQALATRYPQHRGLDMVEKLLESLNLRCGVSERSLAQIPERGPLIIVSNHPTGLADGFVLMNAVSRVRRDVRAIVNPLLMYLEPMTSLAIPFDKNNPRVSEDGRRQMDKQLEDGGVLMLCPAGDVSRMTAGGLQDRQWRAGFVRLARKYRAPVLPVFIHGRNGLGYYITATVAPLLAALLLAQQMFRKHDSTMDLTIGAPIPFDSWGALKLSEPEIAEKFRQHVVQLGKGQPGSF
ncbi:MAG: 1-acyl-sn-glycerol-3-phosphate acyltransferase [Burkholderiaceae bacterium]|jgi:putative hemolysin|nr:1-acyl-sn-glycerol-3-phosphate acyltransferase [Burkholderiaceae bacterium]